MNSSGTIVPSARGRLAGQRVVVMGGIPKNLDTSLCAAFRSKKALRLRSWTLFGSSQRTSPIKSLLRAALALPFSCDMADEMEVGRVAAELSSLWESIDVLITTTGIAIWHSVRDSKVSDWAEVIRQDLLGPVVCSKAFLSLLECQGGGAIVHLSSVDGLYGNPGAPSFSTAKGGILPANPLHGARTWTLRHSVPHDRSCWERSAAAVADRRSHYHGSGTTSGFCRLHGSAN